MPTSTNNSLLPDDDCYPVIEARHIIGKSRGSQTHLTETRIEGCTNPLVPYAWRSAILASQKPNRLN